MKSKGKVLIVEDETAIADNLQAILQFHGFEVLCAFDGAQGVELARSQAPDLILLDVMLPKLDGFDVCRVLRANPTTQHIQIIMVTALGRMGEVEKAFQCGANDYLIKPFDTERLLKKIDKALGR